MPGKEVSIDLPGMVENELKRLVEIGVLRVFRTELEGDPEEESEEERVSALGD